MPFYNRAIELEALKSNLASKRAELVIIYGRRGSGKSQLLVQTIAGHNALYYQASARLLPQQLADLTDELQRVINSTTVLPPLNSIDDFFAAIIHLAQKNPQEPFIVVIDEFPYFVEAADPGAETVIQRWWDMNYQATPNLKVFLTGSHVSWMREHTITKESAPLQNRRTGQLEVRPLTYQHAAEFYPAWAAQDKVRAYGIWGGLPRYLCEIDPTLDLWENVSKSFLTLNARLADEPDWLRFTDLRADSLYTSIVREIALGASLPSEIAKAVGRRQASDVFDPLDKLVNAGFVARIETMNSHRTRTKRSRYQIADPFLTFWYRFIDDLRSVLQRGEVAAARAQIQQTLDEYIGKSIFEDICREWVWTAGKRGFLPADLGILNVGTWWGGTSREQDEIDVVALSMNHKAILFGECKWSNSPMDLRDLGSIRHAIEMAKEELDPIPEPWRVCFSRSGFHPDLIAEAHLPENRILLIGPDELYA